MTVDEEYKLRVMPQHGRPGEKTFVTEHTVFGLRGPHVIPELVRVSVHTPFRCDEVAARLAMALSASMMGIIPVCAMPAAVADRDCAEVREQLDSQHPWTEFCPGFPVLTGSHIIVHSKAVDPVDHERTIPACQVVLKRADRGAGKRQLRALYSRVVAERLIDGDMVKTPKSAWPSADRVFASIVMGYTGHRDIVLSAQATIGLMQVSIWDGVSDSSLSRPADLWAWLVRTLTPADAGQRRLRDLMEQRGPLVFHRAHRHMPAEDLVPRDTEGYREILCMDFVFAVAEDEDDDGKE